MKSEIAIKTWVAWLGGAVAAASSAVFIATTFVYAEFETKGQAKEKFQAISARLIRIEEKLDALNEMYWLNSANSPVTRPSRIESIPEPND